MNLDQAKQDSEWLRFWEFYPGDSDVIRADYARLNRIARDHAAMAEKLENLREYARDINAYTDTCTHTQAAMKGIVGYIDETLAATHEPTKETT